MKLYVIRHGETDVNLENKINALNDDDLNETGIQQAKELAKKVQKKVYQMMECWKNINIIIVKYKYSKKMCD